MEKQTADSTTGWPATIMYPRLSIRHVFDPNAVVNTMCINLKRIIPENVFDRIVPVVYSTINSCVCQTEVTQDGVTECGSGWNFHSLRFRKSGSERTITDASDLVHTVNEFRWVRLHAGLQASLLVLDSPYRPSIKDTIYWVVLRLDSLNMAYAEVPFFGMRVNLITLCNSHSERMRHVNQMTKVRFVILKDNGAFAICLRVVEPQNTKIREKFNFFQGIDVGNTQVYKANLACYMTVLDRPAGLACNNFGDTLLSPHSVLGPKN